MFSFLSRDKRSELFLFSFFGIKKDGRINMWASPKK